MAEGNTYSKVFSGSVCRKNFAMHRWYPAANETQLPHLNRPLWKPLSRVSHLHRPPPTMKTRLFLEKHFGSRSEFTTWYLCGSFCCPQMVPAHVLRIFFSTSRVLTNCWCGEMFNPHKQCEMWIHSPRKKRSWDLNLILEIISAWNTFICTMK